MIEQEIFEEPEAVACLKCRGGDSDVFAFLGAVAEDAVGGLGDHFLEQQPEVGALAVVGRGDVFDTAGMSGKLETFPEGLTGGVFGIIDRDALTAIPRHDGEAGDIGRAVADVNHVLKRDRALVGGHVVVDVLVVA